MTGNQLTSIPTNIGAAVIVKLAAPFQPIEWLPGWGAILWGRSTRIDALKIALNLKDAAWIADYDPNQGRAIVVWSDCYVEIGSRVEFDTTLVPAEAICPSCDSTKYVANGKHWKCKDCGRQWVKNPKVPRKSPRSRSRRIATN